MSWRKNNTDEPSQNTLSPQKGEVQNSQNQVITQKLQQIETGVLEDYVKNPQTIKMLQKRGINSLFPIQIKTYHIVYNNEDLIGCDRTGSGKTLSYCLPLTERLRDQGLFQKKSKKPLILVILPTRELSMQVFKEFDMLVQNKEYKCLSIYGGTNVADQINEVIQGIDVAVGTPGRILDLLNRNVLQLTDLQTIIIDEADVILNMGFQDDIEEIYSILNEQRKNPVQNLLFSATIPRWVHNIADKYLSKNKKFVDLIKNSETKTSLSVEHLVLNCPYHLRLDTIGDLVLQYSGQHQRTIIFTETRNQANDIMLNARINQETAVLHGEIPQNQREVTFQAFRDGKIKCLIATNVAARGLDIPEIDLIIQLDPPKDVDNYIHRAGRTARAGRTGTCITFYTDKQLDLIDQIEKRAKIKFKKIGAPQPADIINASMRDIKLALTSVNKDILSLFKESAKELIKDLGNEEALERALAYISGYTKGSQVKQRSLITSFEGYITYTIQGESFKEIQQFIQEQIGKDFLNQLKPIRTFLDKKGVAFDVQEQNCERIDRLIEEENVGIKHNDKLFIIEKAVVLPQLEEQPQSSFNDYDKSNRQTNYQKNQNKPQSNYAQKPQTSKPQEQSEKSFSGFNFINRNIQ